MPHVLAVMIATFDFVMTHSAWVLLRTAVKPLIHNFIVSGNGIIRKLTKRFEVQKHGNHYLVTLVKNTNPGVFLRNLFGCILSGWIGFASCHPWRHAKQTPPKCYVALFWWTDGRTTPSWQPPLSQSSSSSSSLSPLSLIHHHTMVLPPPPSPRGTPIWKGRGYYKASCCRESSLHWHLSAKPLSGIFSTPKCYCLMFSGTRTRDFEP